VDAIDLKDHSKIPDILGQEGGNIRPAGHIRPAKAPFYAFKKLIRHKRQKAFFWRKNISKKAAHKMLMKLSTGVNFVNIL